MRPSISKIVQNLESLLPAFQIYKNPIVFPDVGRQRYFLSIFKCKIQKKTSDRMIYSSTTSAFQILEFFLFAINKCFWTKDSKLLVTMINFNI